MTRVVSKLPHVGTTIFTVMSQRAAELGAINLAQGFPDYDPPDRLKDLLTEKIRGGLNQYAPMAGDLALRQQVSAKFFSIFAVTCVAIVDEQRTNAAFKKVQLFLRRSRCKLGGVWIRDLSNS